MSPLVNKTRTQVLELDPRDFDICLCHCHPRIVCVISFQKIYGLMIYKAVEVIWIFSTGRVEIEGTLRGPRRPKTLPEAQRTQKLTP